MKTSLRTEIIAVGTELLLGQIANTNAQWMSKQLALHGINTYFHTVVGDNIDRLVAIFEQAKKRSNVIIISGGLGPTEDDLSREAFQQISNIPIVEEPKSLRRMQRFFERHRVTMTSNNLRQTRVFKDSLVLNNQYGMAPGNLVSYKDRLWIFLPGVPREMKQIFSDEVIPYLRKINGEQIIQSLVLKFTSIGESILEDKLKDLIQKQTNPTIALLSQKDGMTIRLTAKAKTIDEADELLQRKKDRILQRVGSFYYGENEDQLEEAVYKQLMNHNKTVAVAESLTGGAFQQKLVSVKGASHVFKGGIVSYDTSVKINTLQISKETIAKEGTVSEACAKEMAKNVSQLMDASIGISFTGVAGPEEVEGKRVGTVFISLYDQDGTIKVEEHLFPGDRQQIRYRAVLKGFEMLLNYLK